MSNSIDNQVVEMRFENRQFESGVKESLSTLDRLKKALRLDGVKDGFEDITRSAKNVDMNPLNRSLATVTESFSAAEVVAVRFLANIVDDAYRAGKALVKNLTVDQVTAGWDKYNAKIQNVQTIMNGTGEDLDTVNGYLEKLMWFSDETSYNFSDMTTAMSTMVAKGADLDTVVPMIWGIAEATAYAGKTGFDFQRTINNLVQSYSGGYLTLMDWKSLQLAGTNSKALTESLIRAAEELGKVNKGAITLENFTESLKDKWADQEVMERAFSGWAQMMMDAYDLVNSGEFDLASEAIDALSGNYDEYVEKATEAAQASKSFTDSIEATKDAVSTKWMRSFELIIGDFEQSKALFTDITEYLYELFAESGNARNELLAAWNTFSPYSEEHITPFQMKALVDFGFDEEAITGRDTVINSIWNVLNAIRDTIYLVKSSFNAVFPPMTYKRLYNITYSLMKLTEKLKMSEETASEVSDIMKGVFSIFDIFGQVIKTVGRGIMDFVRWLSPAGKSVLSFAGGMGRLVVKFDEALKKSRLLQFALDSIEQVFSPLGEGIKIVINAILDLIQALTGIDLRNFGEWADRTEFDLTPVVDIFKALGNGIRAFGEELKKAKPLFEGVKQTLTGLFITAKNWFKDFFTNVNIDGMGLLQNGLLGGIIFMLYKMYDLLSEAKQSSILKSFKELFDGLANYVSGLNKKLRSGNVIKVAIALLALAYAMTLLADIPKDKLLGAMSAVALLGFTLSMVLENVEKIINGASFRANFNVNIAIGKMAWIATIGLALYRCAKAVAVLADVPVDRLQDATLNLLEIMTALTAMITVILFMTSDKSYNFTGGSVSGKGATMLSGHGDIKAAKGKGMFGMLLGVAAAVTAISAAIWILVKAAETGNIDAASAALIKLMITMGAVVAVILFVSKWAKTTETAFGAERSNGIFDAGVKRKKGIVGTLYAVMAYIVVIAALAALLSKVPNIEKGTQAMSDLAGFTIVLAGVMTAISVIAAYAQGSKQLFDIKGIMFGVAAMVASIGLVLVSIAKLPKEDVNRALVQIIALGAIMSAMVFIATLIAWFANNKIKGGIDKFATSMLKLAGTFALVGLGLIVFTAGLLAIIGAGGAIVAGIGIIATAIGLILLEIARLIVDAAPVIAEAIVAVKMAMIMGWIKALSDFGQEMIDGVLKIAYMALEAVINNAGPLIDLLMRGIILIFEGIGKRAPELVAAWNAMTRPFVEMIAGEFSTALAVGGLEGVVLAFKAVFKTLASMKSDTRSALSVAIAITVVMALMGGVLYLLRNLDPKQSLDMVGSMAAFMYAAVGIIAIFSFIESDIATAATAAASLVTFFGILIGGAGLIALIVGAAEHWGTADALIQRGFNTINLIVENIGGLVGRFVGGIVGGYEAGKFNQMAEGVTTISDMVATMVSNFGGDEAAKAATTMSTVFDALKKMVEFSIADSIAAWAKLGKSPQDMFGDLKSLGESLTGFQEATKGINSDAIQPGVDALAILMTALDKIPLTGGNWQTMTGELDLDKFGTGLGILAEGLVDFQAKSSGLDEAIIKPATAAASIITEFTKTLPPTSGGLIGYIAGSTDIEEFGKKLGPLAEGLVAFQKVIDEAGGLDNLAVSKAGWALKAVTEAAALIPATKGITNAVDVGTFGKYMVEYAKQAVVFTDTYAGVNAETFALAVTHMTDLSNLARDLSGDTTVSSESIYNLMLIFEEMKNLVNAFAGLAGADGMDDPTKAESVAASMKAIGKGAWDFDHEIRRGPGIDPVTDLYALTLLKSMANTAQSLDAIKKPDNLMTAIKSFGTGLLDFETVIADVELKNVTDAMGVIEDVATTAANITANDDAVYNLSMVVAEMSAMLNGFAGPDGVQLNSIPASMSTLVTDLVTSYTTSVNEKAPLLITATETIIGSIGDTLSDDGAQKKIFDKAARLAVAAALGVASVKSKMIESGKNIVQGLIEGMEDRETHMKLERAASGLGRTVKTVFDNELSIRSPSRAMYQSGVYVGQGLINALIDSTAGIQNEATVMAVQVVSAVDTAVAQVYDILDNAGDFSPTIRPVIDASYAKSGAGTISRMFEDSGLIFNFESFNRNARAINRLETDKRRRVSVAAKQPEVVEAINAVASRIDALDEDILNMKLVLDSGATVGGIYKKMDKRLGKTVRDKKRGAR